MYIIYLSLSLPLFPYTFVARVCFHSNTSHFLSISIHLRYLSLLIFIITGKSPQYWNQRMTITIRIKCASVYIHLSVFTRVFSIVCSASISAKQCEFIHIHRVYVTEQLHRIHTHTNTSFAIISSHQFHHRGLIRLHTTVETGRLDNTLLWLCAIFPVNYSET